MKTVPPELLLVLFVLAVALVQFLLKLREARPPPPPEAAPDETPLEDQEPLWRRPEATAPGHAVPSAPGIGFGRAAAASAPRPPPSGRFDRRSLMGNRRALQDAIVIAAIVGPCRAIEPHEPR